jgi:AcrR family transcriptional regulator
MAIEELQARPSLSRERILRAAVEVMDAEGLEAVTMRRIGRELGVEAMSLYNHVEDKAAILDGICEVVMAEFAFPPESDDWRDLVRSGACAWRDMLRAHPNVIALFAERKHPLSSIDALRPMEFALDVLRRSGLPDAEVVNAFRVLGGYIMGFVMIETGKMMSGMGGEQDATREDVAELVPADEVPNFLALLPYLGSCEPNQNFDFGLELIISGIEARIAANPAR